MGTARTHVSCTDAAARLIRELVAEHGALAFHQSCGCCNGESPMCFLRDEFWVDEQDVHLGDIEGCPFYVSRRQLEHSRPKPVVLDAVPGRAGCLSLEAFTGKHFVVRSAECD